MKSVHVGFCELSGGGCHSPPSCPLLGDGRGWVSLEGIFNLFWWHADNPLNPTMTSSDYKPEWCHMANQPSWATVTAPSTAPMHATDSPLQPLPFPTAQVPTHLSRAAPNGSPWADGCHFIIASPFAGGKRKHVCIIRCHVVLKPPVRTCLHVGESPAVLGLLPSASWCGQGVPSPRWDPTFQAVAK